MNLDQQGHLELKADQEKEVSLEHVDPEVKMDYQDKMVQQEHQVSLDSKVK